MWDDDAGIGITLAQKVENYSNEKKEYREKFKRVSSCSIVSFGVKTSDAIPF
jgi:hypothetical protein